MISFNQSETEALKVSAAKNALAEDIAQVKEIYNFDVRYSISIKGGPDIYTIIDLSDQKVIRTIELGRSGYYPGQDNLLYHKGELQEKLGEMIGLSISELKELIESDKILYEDIRALENEFGISCYKPNALPLEERILNKQNQILYVTTEFFNGHFYSSSDSIGTISVKISEYIPGKRSYPQTEVYQRGQLRKAFMENSPLVLAYLERVLINAKNVRNNNFRGIKNIDWIKIAETLATNFAKF